MKLNILNVVNFILIAFSTCLLVYSILFNYNLGNIIVSSLVILSTIITFIEIKKKGRGNAKEKNKS